MTVPLFLVGGGGHCHSCIDVIETGSEFSVAGIIDLPEKKGEEVLGYPVVGSDADLPALARDQGAFLVTLGQIGSATGRSRLFEQLSNLGARLPVIVSPRAHLSRHASVGAGTIVMHGALINARARVGCNCIINTAAIVEHDAVVGDHCHISTGCIINGGCQVGDGVFVGSNSVLVQGVRIGAGLTIGAGTVVTRDLIMPGVYVGNPARRVG